MAEREELDLVVNLVDNASAEAERITNRMTRMQNESVRAGQNMFGTTANLAGGGANTQAQFAQAMRNQQNYISQYETRLIGRIDAAAKELREGGNRQLRGADYWRSEIQRHTGMLSRAADDAVRDIIQRRIAAAQQALIGASAGGALTPRLVPPLSGPSTSVPSVPGRAPFASPWTAPPPPPPPPPGGPGTSVPSVGRPGFGPQPWGPTAPPSPPQVPPVAGASWFLSVERAIRSFIQLRAFGVNPTLAGISALSSGFGGLAKAAGPLGIALGTVGIAAVAAHKAMSDFADDTMKWSQMQKQTGIDIGVLKNATNQFKEQGFEVSKTQEALAGFADFYRQMQLNPTFKHKFLEGVQQDQIEDMSQFYDSLKGLTSEQALKRAVEQEQQIRANVLERNKGDPAAAERAAAAGRDFMRKFQAESLSGFKGEYKLTDPADVERMRRMAEEAQKYHAAVSKTSEAWSSIYNTVGAHLTQRFGFIANMLATASSALDRALKRWYDFKEQKIDPNAPIDPANPNRSQLDILLGTGKGAATPQPLLGGGLTRGLADDVGLSDIRAGGGYGHLPQSENIEDRRNEAVRLLTDETGDQTKATEELTGQMRTLNDFYTRLFAGDQGIGGGPITTGAGEVGGAGRAGRAFGAGGGGGGGTTFRPFIRTGGGGGPPGTGPGTKPPGADGAAPAASDIDAAAQAIRTIESGSAAGNYGALGPVTKSGDRAYGAYQVMGKNVGEWTQEHYGKRLTPQEFLQNKEAQDAVFKGKFGGYMQTYGAEGAAQAWFGGPGSVGKAGRRDVLGTSVGGYGSRFSQLYQGAGGGKGGQQAGSSTTAQQPNPGGGDQPPPADILAKAREVAQLGPLELSKFMERSGYPQNDNWCGDFAATVVKAAGGTPPEDWRKASNWRNVGPEVSASEARPGDIAVARPGWSSRGSGRTGEIGSHVTILDRMDPKTGQFYGTGGNQGGGRRATTAPFQTSRFQFYRPQPGKPPPPPGSAAAPMKSVPFTGMGAGWGTGKRRDNIKIIDAPEGPGGGSVSATDADADAAPSLNAGKWWKGTPAGAPIRLPSSTTNTSSPGLRDQPSDEPGAHMRPVRIGDARAAMDRAQSNAMTVRGEGRIRVYNELTNGNKMEAQGKGPLFSKVTVHRDVQMPETSTGSAYEM
jgi:hypothetical protein